jgi:hypothetical protein
LIPELLADTAEVCEMLRLCAPVALFTVTSLLVSPLDARASDAVQWVNTVYATSTGSALQKTAGCGTCADAGATSSQILSGDGALQFTPVPGARLYAGLGTNSTTNTDPAQIDFAFSFWPDGGWDIRERNVYKREGRFVAGDVFRIAIAGGAAQYYQNGALVYSSTAPPTYPMVVDTTLIGTGATIATASLDGAAAGSARVPLVITTTSLPATRLADTYSAMLAASGGSGAFRWSVAGGSLPAGLSLDPISGTIAGTPTTAGRFTVTIRATDAADTSNVADRSFGVAVLAQAPPSSYDAVTDRAPRDKPALPALSGAGYAFSDPAFGSRMVRITDGNVRPGALNRSYRTPSSTHENAWSADARFFYTVSTDGTVIPFSFDATTMRAARLQPSTTGDGGLTVRFFNEPTFSYVTPGVMYGTYSGSGSNLRSVDQYDLETGQYSQLLNLDSLVAGLSGTYTGGLGVSAGPVEKLFAFFGGTGQDHHFYLVVFDKANPADRHLLDTKASTVDGVATNLLLNFSIHAASIDRSGRYVAIYPSGVDQQAPRSAAPTYVWDTSTNQFAALPLVSARSGGHDAFGFGVRVNQDCCTSSTWDAAQWQFRALDLPLTTWDLVTPVLLPKEVYLADHASWHNAQPDRLVPFVDANYRYGANATAWRAWDEEVFAVQTEGAGGGATVWRFAHHRSKVADDADPSRISFWYTPRANVSPDGHFALFTSNWEKTLGTDPRGEAGGAYRQDVFLVELQPIAVPPPPPVPVAITTTTLPSGQVGQSIDATLSATGGSGTFTWSVASGSLPAGVSLNASSGLWSGTPTAAGTFTFTIRASDASDAANCATATFTVAIAAQPPVAITTSTLPDGYRLSAYAATLIASGGRAPLTWSVISGKLPPGLTLNGATGAIAGTPTKRGLWSFTVQASDAATPATSSTKVLSIRIRAPR